MGNHITVQHTATQPPEVGSPKELAVFRALQARLAPMFREIFPDRRAPRTVIIVPSYSLDQEVMATITGVHHYEERLLCLLLLLRLPCTRVVYVTSQLIPEPILDYYLHLLPGIPAQHARRRLTLLACHDATPRPLTAKILERPRLMQRIREAIRSPDAAHLTCFNVSDLERTLAVRLHSDLRLRSVPAPPRLEEWRAPSLPRGRRADSGKVAELLRQRGVGPFRD